MSRSASAVQGSYDLGVWDGPTIAATILGGLGFVVAGVSLGWQITNELRRRQTRVRVQLARSSVWSPRPGEDEVIVVSGVNESSHTVEITKVGLEFDRGEAPGITEVFWPPVEGATLPGAIEPHSVGITTHVLKLGGSYANGAEDDVPLRAYVYAGDGSRFASSWVLPDAIPWAVHLTQIPIAESLRRTIQSFPRAPREGETR